MTERRRKRRRERTSARSRKAKRPSGTSVVGIRALVGFAGGVLVGAAVLVCVSVVPAAAAGVEGKPFGIARFTMQTTQTRQVPHGPGIPGSGFVNEPYTFTQAGGHPYALTSTLEFASEEVGTDHSLVPTRDPRDMIIDLPPGLSADPLAVSRCRLAQAVAGKSCPVDSQVGVFVLRFASKAMLGPIVDLTPEAGRSAELGLETPFKVMFPLTGHVVRTPQGYGLSIVGNGLPALSVVSVETTLWGVPAATVHDPQRGLSCTAGDVNQQWSCQGGGVPSGEAPVAFLTMPSDCSAGPQTGIAWADSWEEPGRYEQGRSTLPGMTGCDLLPFDPEIEVKPDTLLADEPVGVSVGIGVHQTESPQEVATPQLRGATVTLPQGVSISPGVADGVQACKQTGREGIDIPTGLNASGEPLKPGEIGEGEEAGLSGEPRLAPGHCPEASTVGAAEALTPLLPSPIKGRVYLATPGCGGPGQGSCTEEDAVDGNLYRLYVELGGSGVRDEGVNIKVEGKVEANPATGQLTVKLMENPQLPLSQLNIDLGGGPRALLDNPATCGPARTTSDLEPWSAPGTTPAPESLFMPGTSDADPSSFYDVTGCASSPTLNPGMLAGTLTSQAGAFSAFTFSVTRSDREPYLSRLQLRTPPGLSAMLSSVPLCEGVLANTGKCPEASRIGSTLVASGAGSHPYEMPGRIYLTAGYEGAPFGLSIVTDAVAGPLNLGLVVIRAQINIDPETSALTITSDPLPQIVLGIPLRLQRVTLNIDRPGFMFNPTNCKAQQVTATIAGAQGATAHASNPFAAGGCKSLAFKPNLEASTSAHTSYTNGASLDMRLTFPNVEQGAEANLAQIKVALPRQLPSRLTTLQNACPDTTFHADPSACPKASIVGIARARTPVLPVELAGPVYFVSHGRNAFPSPIVVLQGDGVRLDLLGSTVIDKTGIASVAFKATPDVPVASLELYLPQGPHSVLSANTSLCALRKTVTVKRNITQQAHGRTVRHTVKMRKRVPATLTMPTELVAQNGAVIHQNTKIDVTGCAASKAKTARRSRSYSYMRQTRRRMRRDADSRYSNRPMPAR
jgi:hypothetical protein